MLRRIIHRSEWRHLNRADNRKVRPFEWGLDFLDPFQDNAPLPQDPKAAVLEFNSRAVADSDQFFSGPAIGDFNLIDGEHLVYPSPIRTPFEANNTAYARYFPVGRNGSASNGHHRYAVKDARGRAVVVLPHWNAKPEEHVVACRLLNAVGIAALRLSLPYHDRRMLPGFERADFMVSANLGRTIQASRQAVLDTRAAVDWLVEQGYDRIGIIGTSIGSCIAFLAFVHDERIRVGVHNHVSSYFGDVVWDGITTAHVREALQTALTRDEVRRAWLAISPYSYIDRAAECSRRRLFISARYDLSFTNELSRLLFDECDRRRVMYDRSIIPCGHYTLGKAPFKYYVGYRLASYLVKHL